MKKIITIAVLALVFMGAVQATQVHAGTTELTGWAWSPNIGWLSFNSTNSGANPSGTGSAYSVKVSTTTGSDVGTFSGQAWSPNVGWLSFDTTGAAAIGTDCPSGTCAATVNMVTGVVSGWGQILSMKLEDTGGWLRLSGTNHASPDFSGFQGTSTKGVTYNKDTGALTGFAYEPSAIGWISFGAANEITPGCTGTGCGVCIGICHPTSETALAGGTCTTNGGSTAVTVTDGSSVSFGVSGVTGGTGSYTYSWNADGSGYVTHTTPYSFTYSGEATYSPVVKAISATDSSNWKSITCPSVIVSGGGGPSSGLKLMIASPATTLNTTDYNDALTTNKSLQVTSGSIFKLQWNIDPATRDAGYTMCSGDVTPLNGPSGSWGSINSGLKADMSTTNITPGSYTFTLTCTGPSKTPKASSVSLKIVKADVTEI